ncbi:MAG TPA: hypothetical protein DEQ49_00350 [Arthrobacter bacterium]|nr:hypothetical protein [Arthrobacter sp.]HCC38390.1 hypothetical protein [Arthrobacter sp.]
MNPQPISDQTWEAIRAEFTLPALGQVHCRLSELMEDPDGSYEHVSAKGDAARGTRACAD